MELEIDEIIINHITKALREEFTTSEIVAIRNYQTQQSFTKPCIVVLEYDAQEEHLGNNYSKQWVWYDITIHINTETTTTGIHPLIRKYARRISRVLDYITIPAEYTRGRQISLKKHDFKWSVVDNVGHINIAYTYITSEHSSTPITPITKVDGNNYIKK